MKKWSWKYFDIVLHNISSSKEKEKTNCSIFSVSSDIHIRILHVSVSELKGTSHSLQFYPDICIDIFYPWIPFLYSYIVTELILYLFSSDFPSAIFHINSKDAEFFVLATPNTKILYCATKNSTILQQKQRKIVITSFEDA